MKTLSTFLLTTVLAASLALAQHPGRGRNPEGRVQHRVTFLTTLLSLTTAQQQQATAIYSAAATAEAALHTSFQSAHQGLADAIHANDSAGIEQNATTIGNLTAQMTANHAKADAAFYQILTPDQQAKLTQFESQNHGHSGMGMGPMHGGPH